jgi:hypothetical protein
MDEITISYNSKKLDEETLRINTSTRRANGRFSMFRWKDKDTLQFVLYIPSLEITAYGETEERAREMLDSAVRNFFQWLMNLPKKQIDQELIKLKFKRSTFFNKQFSKAYVDLAGELQNFNAAENKVERLTLQTA